MNRLPNKIIIIWRTVEGYEPQPFHFFYENEIEKARKFTTYAMEKDYEDKTTAKYSITFYEKNIDK